MTYKLAKHFYSVLFSDGIVSGEVLIEARPDEVYAVAEREVAALGYAVDSTMTFDAIEES